MSRWQRPLTAWRGLASTLINRSFLGRALSATQVQVRFKDVVSRFRLRGTGDTRYSATILADKPLAYYRLDEQAGLIAADYTGNGNDGAITDTGTIPNQPGALSCDPDACMVLDGVSGAIALPASLNTDGLAAVTFECWFNLPNPDNLGNIRLINSGDPNANNAGMDMAVGPGGAYAFVYVGNGTTNTSVFTGTLNLYAWYHLVATYDSVNLKLYLNGVQVGGSSPLTGVVGTSGLSPWIGRLATSVSAFYGGQIDEVAIYNYALTATQVQNHWQVANMVTYRQRPKIVQRGFRQTLINSSFGMRAFVATQLQIRFKDISTRFLLGRLRDIATRFRLYGLNNLTVYPNSATSTTLGTAGVLVGNATIGTNAATPTVLLGTATGFGELWAGGNAGAWAAGSLDINIAPTGHGLFLDDTSLDAKSIISGNWAGGIRLKTSANTVTGDLYYRAYVYNAGVYTQIGVLSLTGQTPTSTIANFVFSATAFQNAYFPTGSKLYIDRWFNITSTTMVAGGTLQVNVNSVVGNGLAAVYISTPGVSAGYSFNDIVTRFILVSGATQSIRDITARFVLRSADQLKDVSTRFRLRSADQLKDIAARFRLSQSSVRDIATRLRIRSADQLKDIASRLRLGLVRDIATRFRLANLKDIASRFRLMSAGQLRDISTRFKLATANQSIRDVATRLRLMSANQFKDVATRLRLGLLRDIQTRFRLAQQRVNDVSTRLRLRSADQARDVASRFRLRSANQLRDVQARFRLAQQRIGDVATRFRLRSANQARDVASRLRLMSANQLKDVATRFRLARLRDVVTRFRLQSANQLRDVASRLRLASANQLRDIATRLRLCQVRSGDVSSRFLLSVANAGVVFKVTGVVIQSLSLIGRVVGTLLNTGIVKSVLSLTRVGAIMPTPFTTLQSTITATDVNGGLVSNASIVTLTITYPDQTTQAFTMAGGGITNLGAGQYQAKYNTKGSGPTRELWNVVGADGTTVATYQIEVGVGY